MFRDENVAKNTKHRAVGDLTVWQELTILV
jgi:hypothetical protein